ncbi:MAG: PIN domain-containing protein [Actinomycetota bacterium]
MILADTSGLLSLYNRREPTHPSVAEAVAQEQGPFVVSPYVVAELDYLVSTRLGADAEQRVLAELATPAYVLASVDRDDLRACAELISRHAGIGVTDASMLVLADRLGIARVLTLHRRHFEAVRTPSGRALAIVP